MASAWKKWVATAVLLAACVILVTAYPSTIYDEELMEPAADQQQSVDDFYPANPVRRTRRDSLAYASGHGGGGHGWGWYPPVGPVFTYVRTDPHANFQWGVRHKVYGWGWKSG